MDSPYCGCPQKNSSIAILELRAEGLDPGEIIEEFSRRYGIYAYQGDLINYLDQAVRNLEAIEALSRVLGKGELSKEAGEIKKKIEGE
jgi:helicase